MNRTEKFVYQFLNAINISQPYQLGIENISDAINLPVFYWEYGSEAVFYRGKYKIFICDWQTNQQKWQDFGHELCHILSHDGDQKQIPTSFLQMQEHQAEYFSYHLCVPTFMLLQLEEISINSIMYQFNVDFEFASKRLSLLQNKILGVINHERIKRQSI